MRKLPTLPALSLHGAPRLLALALVTGLLSACGGGEPVKQPPAPVVTRAAPTPATDDALADRYLAAKERLGALLPEDKAGPGRILTELGPGLREVAESAKDVHLRANASLLLGTLYQQSGDLRTAISFFRQAAALLPSEAGPSRVLAIALAADKQYAPAIVEQRKVVADDPDDLEAWLLMGELGVKSGDKDLATEAYAAYEMRRKGLIDGLTLKSADGVFTLPPDQRASCARALIPARDNGTAIALIYSLSIETDPAVRVAVVEAMGAHRLTGYKPALEPLLTRETDQEVKEAIGWALAEIQRDPLESKPGPTPVDPSTPDAKTDAKAGTKSAADAKSETKTDAKAETRPAVDPKAETNVPAAPAK
jgi:tetratricopeptide (TPR) repeat protein